MKKQTFSAGLFAVVASLCSGCVTEGTVDETQVDDAVEQELLAGSTLMNDIMIWPAGPITWNGTAGTWPIAVWSSSPITFLGVDLVGPTNLSLGLSTMSGLNTFTPMTGFTAGPISPIWFDTINTGLTGLPWAGSLGLGLNTLGVGTASVGSPFLLTPSITTNALMFSDLPLLTGFSPFIVNVGFDMLDVDTFGALNIFASTAGVGTLSTLSTTAGLGMLPFSSSVLPISGFNTLSPLVF
jgi:hypothetical protein